MPLATCTAPLSLFGSSYLFSPVSFPSREGAGERNRAEYARQYGVGGERLVAELGRGHQSQQQHHRQPDKPVNREDNEGLPQED